MVYTIGYQGKSVNDFLTLLEEAEIDRVVDVRERPVSRWRPQYSKSRLSEKLAQNEIGYTHLRALGTPKEIRDRFKDSGNIVQFHRAYGKHLEKQKDSIDELIAMIDDYRVCLLCFEQNAKQCHRSYLAWQLKQETDCLKEIIHLG